MYREPETYFGAWNFGPDHDSNITVGAVVDKVVEQWGSGSWVNLCGRKEPYEAELLNLDISKAKSYLHWFPLWTVEMAIEKTVDWYKEYEKEDPYKICVSQIEEFQSETRGSQDV